MEQDPLSPKTIFSFSIIKEGKEKRMEKVRGEKGGGGKAGGVKWRWFRITMVNGLWNLSVTLSPKKGSTLCGNDKLVP